MRTARIKVVATEAESVYHVMTRVVNGERVIDEVGREVLRKQLWQVADYGGVQILTYAILSNHFHVLVRIPKFSLRSPMRNCCGGTGCCIPGPPGISRRGSR